MLDSKIKVLGWYGHGNIGDEAYKLAFPIIIPQHELIFTDKITGVEENVILGGGDVLNNYFLNQLRTHPPKNLYAMSVNLMRRDIDTESMFKRIILRNKNIICENSKYLPDFVFILKANRQHGRILVRKLFEKHKADLYEKLVIIVMNSYLSPTEAVLARDYITFEKVCCDLARLCDSTTASFMMLPFGNGFPRNDRVANSMIYTRCKFWKKNIIVYEDLNIQDTLDICAAADAIISTRLHACIFSCIGGTPFIDLTHHDKTKLFLQTIDRTDWSLNYYHLDLDQLKKLLVDFLTSSHYRTGLENLANNNRILLLQAAGKIP
jgi:polysaccharide pyruvyl transferase WcaK-like protein